MKVNPKLLPLLITPILTACGGGGGGGSSSGADTSSPDISQGVFIDSQVAGLNYQTSSGLSGVTDSEGRFNAAEADAVSFSLGGLVLGGITSFNSNSPVVTPAQIVQNDAEKLINVLRILQTVDDNENPDDGITITEETRQLARDSFAVQSINLNSVADFESSSGMQELLNHLNRTGIVPPEDAINHFTDSLADRDIDWEWKEDVLDDDNQLVVPYDNQAPVIGELNLNDSQVAPNDNGVPFINIDLGQTVSASFTVTDTDETLEELRTSLIFKGSTLGVADKSAVLDIDYEIVGDQVVMSMNVKEGVEIQTEELFSLSVSDRFFEGSMTDFKVVINPNSVLKENNAPRISGLLNSEISLAPGTVSRFEFQVVDEDGDHPVLSHSISGATNNDIAYLITPVSNTDTTHTYEFTLQVPQTFDQSAAFQIEISASDKYTRTIANYRGVVDPSILPASNETEIDLLRNSFNTFKSYQIAIPLSVNHGFGISSGEFDIVNDVEGITASIQPDNTSSKFSHVLNISTDSEIPYGNHSIDLVYTDSESNTTSENITFTVNTPDDDGDKEIGPISEVGTGGFVFSGQRGWVDIRGFDTDGSITSSWIDAVSGTTDYLGHTQLDPYSFRVFASPSLLVGSENLNHRYYIQDNEGNATFTNFSIIVQKQLELAHINASSMDHLVADGISGSNGRVALIDQGFLGTHDYTSTKYSSAYDLVGVTATSDIVGDGVSNSCSNLSGHLGLNNWRSAGINSDGTERCFNLRASNLDNKPISKAGSVIDSGQFTHSIINGLYVGVQKNLEVDLWDTSFLNNDDHSYGVKALMSDIMNTNPDVVIQTARSYEFGGELSEELSMGLYDTSLNRFALDHIESNNAVLVVSSSNLQSHHGKNLSQLLEDDFMDALIEANSGKYADSIIYAGSTTGTGTEPGNKVAIQNRYLLTSSSAVAASNTSDSAFSYQDNVNASAAIIGSAIAGISSHTFCRQFPVEEVANILLATANQDFPGYLANVHGAGIMDTEAALEQIDSICWQESQVND